MEKHLMTVPNSIWAWAQQRTGTERPTAFLRDLLTAAMLLSEREVARRDRAVQDVAKTDGPSRSPPPGWPPPHKKPKRLTFNSLDGDDTEMVRELRKRWKALHRQGKVSFYEWENGEGDILPELKRYMTNQDLMVKGWKTKLDRRLVFFRVGELIADAS